MKRFAIALSLVVIGIQFVPVSRDNPPVLEGIAVPPGVREILRTSCYDCHSNETRWPWYSHLAPASWLVQYDVREARSHFNVSEWDADDPEGEGAAGRVRRGEMPPWYYLPAHPEARLDPDEKESLLRGLVATFGDEAHDHDAHSH